MEFKVEDIMAEWEKDCPFNELDLVGSIRDLPKLHAKYVALLSRGKVRLRAITTKYNTTRQLRFRYYRGELTREELAQHDLRQWQGVKPMRAEMDEFLKGDQQLNDLQERIEYMQIVVSGLEAIVRSINSRGFDLRTMLEAKKFYNAVN